MTFIQNKKYNQILSLILLVALSVDIGTTMSLPSSTKEMTVEPKITRESLIIESNEDFETIGFPGDGTLSNPYVITGYEFIDQNENLITIKSTDVYFIIENNTFKVEKSQNLGVYFPSGIVLDNLENGIVKNNEILSVGQYHSLNGISVINSSNLIIRENIFYTMDGLDSISENKFQKGINILFSNDIEIIGNLINIDNGDGILVSSNSSKLLIQANILQSTKSNIGILFGGSDSEILNNNFTNNKRYGLTLWWEGENNLISENNFNENGFFNSGTQISVTSALNTISGNYWSDLTGPDNDNDGIVDVSYGINNSLTTGWLNLTDNMPNVAPFEINLPAGTTLDSFKDPVTTSPGFLILNLILVLTLVRITKRQK